MKISIIIPVYNAADYLDFCIKSIINQTVGDFEILLIDDGSKDSSLEICKNYQNIDTRIKVFHKENGGVSSARNYGICRAQGEYLLFIDSDDYIEPKMLEVLTDQARAYGSDMVFCGFRVIGSNLIKNDTKLLASLEKKREQLSKDEILSSIITVSKNRLFGYVWRTLFKASVIKNNFILFNEKIRVSEDFLFLLQAVEASSSFLAISDELYNYCINSKSTTAQYMPTLHQDMMFVNSWMRSKICKTSERYIGGFVTCQANTYLRTVQNLCRFGNPYTMIERIKKAYEIKREHLYESILVRALFTKQKISLKNRISYLVFILYFEFIYVLLFSAKCRKRT